MNFPILYEDNHLLVIEKPAGMLSQKDKSLEPNVLELSKHYIAKKYNKPGAAFLGLVHRLDKNVGGVLILARTSKAAARLQKSFQNKQVHKYYTALLENKPPKEEDTLKHFCKKNKKLLKSILADPSDTQAKLAILSYERKKMNHPTNFLINISNSIKNLEKYKSDLCCVKISLETGRFHQIRFQLSQIGCPILGDKKYGAHWRIQGIPLALHATRILIPHPIRKDEILDLKSPLPIEWFR